MNVSSLLFLYRLGYAFFLLVFLSTKRGRSNKIGTSIFFDTDTIWTCLLIVDMSKMYQEKDSEYIKINLTLGRLAKSNYSFTDLNNFSVIYINMIE